MTRAPDILTAALGHMQDRAATYDKPEGERSMPATVAAFNALTGHNLTAEQGWLFMTVLKLCRTQQGGHRPDSYEDGAAYFALMGEQAACDRAKPAAVEEPFLVCAGCAKGHGPHAPGCNTEGWIVHDGKGCPVPEGTLVQIRYREPRLNDRTEPFACKQGELWTWPGRANYNPESDIVAYRLA